MTSREAFGPNLRRRRIREGISLEDLARHTRVSVDLWDAMERNDFSKWPVGLQARAFVREYAVAIGVDPSETINDFCRWFPQGDRRAESLVRGTADLVGHELEWRDDLPPTIPRDRRANPERGNAPTGAGPREVPDRRPLARVGAARAVTLAADLLVLCAFAGLLTLTGRVSVWAALAVAAVLYHGVSQMLLGCTPAAWVTEAYLSTQRHFRSPLPIFRRPAPIENGKLRASSFKPES